MLKTFKVISRMVCAHPFSVRSFCAFKICVETSTAYRDKKCCLNYACTDLGKFLYHRRNRYDIIIVDAWFKIISYK